MNRRELFKAFLPSGRENRKEVVRPPYTDRETDFLACKECEGFCAKVCETGVLLRDEEGAPYLSFDRSGCSYCGECARVCPKGVISERKEKRIRARLNIDPRLCSAWNQTLCFSCKEPCLDDAIRFQGLSKPVILQDRCTSCGFCFSLCPTGAIRVSVDEN